jgi:hypothetical protein
LSVVEATSVTSCSSAHPKDEQGVADPTGSAAEGKVKSSGAAKIFCRCSSQLAGSGRSSLSSISDWSTVPREDSLNEIRP